MNSTVLGAGKRSWVALQPEPGLQVVWEGGSEVEEELLQNRLCRYMFALSRVFNCFLSGLITYDIKLSFDESMDSVAAWLISRMMVKLWQRSIDALRPCASAEIWTSEASNEEVLRFKRWLIAPASQWACRGRKLRLHWFQSHGPSNCRERQACPFRY